MRQIHVKFKDTAAGQRGVALTASQPSRSCLPGLRSGPLVRFVSLPGSPKSFLQARQSIKRSLQYESGGVLIDHGRAFGSTDVRGNQFAFDGGRGKSLVPKRDRQFGELAEIACEGAGRLCPWALAAIHIDWQSEHEPYGGAFTREHEHPLRVGGEPFPRNGLHSRRELSLWIAGGHPDGLGAEIEPDKRSADGQVPSGFNEWQDDGHG